MIRNIKLILAAFFLALFVNCNNDDNNTPQITQEFTQTLNASVNGLEFNISDIQDGSQISGNTNCGSIFISTTLENDTEKYSLNITLLKNGEIKEVELWERSETSGPHKLYLTPDFEPKSSIEITNFYYNQEANDISFDFNGTLYLENKVNTTDTKEISGFIELNSFKSKDCSITYPQTIDYNANGFQFDTINSSRTEYPEDLFQNHKFVSNNGYIINLIPEKDLWEMPIGTYDFNTTSSINTVQISKYMGDIIASQLKVYNEEDWRLLDTSGYFTIDNKEQSGSAKNISGVINMNVSLNNESLFDITNMKYSTGSSE